MKDNAVTDTLVNSIVEQVMAALRARGVAAPSSGAPRGASPLTVRPGPVAGKAADAAPQKVFLTAEMLERRLASEATDGRAVELAHNEFLTPAAMDVVDERHLTIRRSPQALASPADGQGSNPVPAASRGPPACAAAAWAC